MKGARWHRGILIAGAVVAGVAVAALDAVGGAPAGTGPIASAIGPQQPPLPTGCERGAVRPLPPGSALAPPPAEMALYYPPELAAAYQAAAADGEVRVAEELGPEWVERAVAVSHGFYALCEWEEANGDRGRQIVLKTWPLPWTTEDA